MIVFYIVIDNIHLHAIGGSTRITMNFSHFFLQQVTYERSHARNTVIAAAGFIVAFILRFHEDCTAFVCNELFGNEACELKS